MSSPLGRVTVLSCHRSPPFDQPRTTTVPLMGLVVRLECTGSRPDHQGRRGRLPSPPRILRVVRVRRLRPARSLRRWSLLTRADRPQADVPGPVSRAKAQGSQGGGQMARTARQWASSPALDGRVARRREVVLVVDVEALVALGARSANRAPTTRASASTTRVTSSRARCSGQCVDSACECLPSHYQTTWSTTQFEPLTASSMIDHVLHLPSAAPAKQDET